MNSFIRAVVTSICDSPLLLGIVGRVMIQGLRILIGLDLCEECFEVVVVPSGELAFVSQAS